MESSYRASVGADSPYSATPPTKPNAAAAIHQRTYQACIPCRKRKVRCDLGSVDNPSDPPCGRCRRESKECYFSATRRKKKGPDDGLSDDGEAAFEIKDGRKRIRTSVPDDEQRHAYGEEEAPRTPGGSMGQSQPLRRPAAPRQQTYNEEDQKTSEQTVGLLQTTEVHGGHDALKLLAEAARKGSRESGARPNINGVSPASLPAAASPIIDRGSSYTNGPMAMLQNDPLWKTAMNPTSNTVDTIDQAAYNSAIKAWERFRFVRAGWFRAKEAIDYIDYFFVHLAPLTPVALNHFRPYARHEELLTNEPMLTITMLLIASRHMKLEGPGSVSRPYSIHQKLWTYLSGMINRVLWGQEQFGGGFCGAGAGGEPGCDVNPLTRKGLRTLGTIESLVLLTEWHPRAMHFPPDEADDELMIPDESSHIVDTSEYGVDASRGIGGQRMDTWLEPCWRSDRMCWMLLGLSMSLAFEIGVFDVSEWQRHARSSDGQPLSAEDIQRYDRRRGNVRNLLLVYVTQTSGRLGLTSMLPSNYSKPEDSTLFKQPIGQQESVAETDLHFWLRMASLMREGNQKLYANKSFTRDLIKNGDYKAVLQQFQEPLRKWREDFDNSAIIPKYMRCILEIEYEYCRVYVNALALQAVAERCANVQPFQSSRPTNGMAAAGATANGIRGDVAIPPQRLAKLLGGDRHYMHEVGDAARNLLKVVVNGLYPGEYLRHAPVRTYFRIISASIVLLKSFSLGATESDVSDSLQLMDKTVEALRGCIVDDVHVASRFADLLDTLTQNLKPRLVRIAADGRSKSRRVSHPGSPGMEATQTAPLNMANQRLHAHQQLATSGTVPNQQQPWSYNTTNNMGTLAPNNPLYGISSDTYDLLDQNNNFSIMPPPTFTWQSPAASQTHSINTPPAGGLPDPYSFGPDGLAEDWFAIDLNPIINSDVNQIVDVSSTMYGPQIGDTDMLELLLSGNHSNMI